MEMNQVKKIKRRMVHFFNKMILMAVTMMEKKRRKEMEPQKNPRTVIRRQKAMLKRKLT